MNTYAMRLYFLLIMVFTCSNDLCFAVGTDIPNSKAERVSLNWISPAEIKKTLQDVPADLIDEQAAINGLFDETYMVPMRDGVELFTKVFKTPFASNLPAIVIRSPYDLGDVEDEAALVSLAGYAVVIQHTRGRFQSEGEDMVFQADGWGELQDGYDTIEWAAQQDWCNGKVGTWGYSALGITGAMAAGANPPSLTCQVISYAATTVYGQTAYQGGVLRQSLLEGWLTGNNSEHMLPVFKAHPTDDAFWQQYDIESRINLIKAPILFVGGFYDCFEQGTLNGFMLSRELGDQSVRDHHKLVMGPWTHVNQTSRTQGQLSYSPESVYSSEITETLNWFNHWLKGEDNGVEDEPAVRYYLMGDVDDLSAPGNEWRTDDTWPPAGATSHAFYFQPDGNLSPISSPGSSESSELMMNPLSPVPTIGGFNLEIPAGPYDQSSIEQRDDVLVFTSNVLEEPVEVIGNVRAVVYAQTNLTDSDIAVRLTDVYPDGRSMLVCDGILRGQFRESFSEPSPLKPGEIHRYDIDLWSTSLVFNKGHRIGVIVSNTNSPRFEMNPIYHDTNGTITKIYHSNEYPSHILLPITSGAPDVGIYDWKAYSLN